jgi:hypothetical protein
MVPEGPIAGAALRRGHATAVQLALLAAGRKPALPAAMHYLCKQRDRHERRATAKHCTLRIAAFATPFTVC